MRKLKTKADLEKKQKKNQLILGIILISLLTLSTAGYSIMNNVTEQNSITSEKGVDFYYQNGLWITDFSDYQFGFQNLPSEVEGVQISTNLTLGNYQGLPVYFVNSNQGTSEILNNIGRFVLRYQNACLEGQNCTENLPSKDCSSNVFIFEASNETKVVQEGNCIYIYGSSINGADAFLYKILGIS